MPQDIYEWAWLVLFVAIVIVRKIHERRAGRRSSLKGVPIIEAAMMIVWGILASAAPRMFIFGGLLDFADYPFEIPSPMRAIGVALFVLTIWLLHRSHLDLDKQWSPTVAFKTEHTLVTEGVYTKCRHPMYAAHVLWGISQSLLLPNLIAGPLALVAIFAVLASRIPREERAMTEEFGNDYRQYMTRTGRILPRLSTLSPHQG